MCHQRWDGWSIKNFAAYGAAKAGMDQMTRILAYELAPSIPR